MFRCAAVAFVVFFLLTGCGSASSPRAGADGEQQTIAGVELKKPGVPVGDVLTLAAGHGVRLDELQASYDFGHGDFCSAGLSVGADGGEPLKKTIAEYKASVSDALGQCYSMNRGTTRTERIRISARRRSVHTDPALVMRFQASGTADDLKSLEDDPRVEAVFLKP